MTPFALLTTLAGLSQREAALVLDVSLDQAKKWSSGARAAPPGVIAELRTLIAQQARAASEALAQIERLAADAGAPEAIELGAPADDDEARSLGWPCVGAWAGMSARVIAASPVPVRLVARGSTLASAAASLTPRPGSRAN